MALKNSRKLKKEQRKNEWTAKGMHRQFAGDMEDKGKKNTWIWMRKRDLKGYFEALIYSAQEQSIRTYYIKEILIKLPSHHFVRCVVQEIRLYLI